MEFDSKTAYKAALDKLLNPERALIDDIFSDDSREDRYDFIARYVDKKGDCHCSGYKRLLTEKAVENLKENYADENVTITETHLTSELKDFVDEQADAMAVLMKDYEMEDWQALSTINSFLLSNIESNMAVLTGDVDFLIDLLDDPEEE